MKVAIIAPPYPLEEAPSPPLGVTYVAAAFEKAGADVKIIDYIVSRYSEEKLQRVLDTFSPDVVGITSVTMNFPAAVTIVQDVKAYDPSIITIMGGPHVSFDTVNTLTTYPAIDLIVVGEGEQTIEELVPVMKKRGDWPGIDGIAYREGDRVVKTNPRQLIADLNTLPLPARHLLPLSRYQALGFPVSIITSRGCPNACIFCLGRRMVGKRVRHRDASCVVDEIEHLLSYGFTRINVADDLFTANKKKVRAVCNEIRRRGLVFSWSAFSRVNTVSTEILELMRDAGCDAVSFGIESGNPAMLKRIRKGITLDQAREAVRICKEVGILAHASFMVGLPGETRETLRDTKAFSDSLGIEFGFHFLAPFPGTTVREEIENYDLEILTNDWNRYDANSAIVRTSQLSAADMNAFVDEYDRVTREAWERMVEGYKRGINTPEDNFRTEGQLRTRLVYTILSEDLIERCGSCSPDSAGDTAETSLDLVCSRIAQITNTDSDLVCKTVRSFVERGQIKMQETAGDCFWYWTHNNGVDSVVI